VVAALLLNTKEKEPCTNTLAGHVQPLFHTLPPPGFHKYSLPGRRPISQLSIAMILLFFPVRKTEFIEPAPPVVKGRI